LATAPILVVNQKAKMLGSTLGYAIFDGTGAQLGTIEELGRGLGERISDSARNVSDHRRRHRFRVVDAAGQVVLQLAKPETGWFEKSRLRVEGSAAVPIGEIVVESSGTAGALATLAHSGLTSATMLASSAIGGITGMVFAVASEGAQDRIDAKVEGLDKIGHARLGLRANGQRLASISADDVSLWDFRVNDLNGVEIARITKTWAGLLKEHFTKADNYVVAMHRPLDEPLRWLVLASALVIDVEFKEQKPRAGRSANRQRRTR
jgi:hypothetical protein